MPHLTEVTKTDDLIATLTALWERSVRASHHFLTDEQIAAIKKCVPEALGDVPHLIVAYDEQGHALGFMGTAQERLEMLFLEPTAFRQGLGRQMVELAIKAYGVTKTTVNEQNPPALGFYQKMGFYVVKRTALDEQGQPYPLLYLERKQVLL